MFQIGQEIFQAKYTEVYTPSASRITTANTEVGSGRQLKCATFSVEEAGTVDFTPMGGGTAISGYPVVAGVAYPFLVKIISAYSQSATKKIWIHHNGQCLK